MHHSCAFSTSYVSDQTLWGAQILSVSPMSEMMSLSYQLEILWYQVGSAVRLLLSISEFEQRLRPSGCVLLAGQTTWLSK